MHKRFCFFKGKIFKQIYLANKSYKDFEDVTDFIRSSLIFDDQNIMQEAFDILKQNLGTPIKDDNSFNSPKGKYGTYYRDRNLVFQSDKFLLNTTASVSPQNYPQKVSFLFQKIKK